MTKTPKKILVVEDEKAINEAYQTVLSAAGYDVKTAYNGQQALRLAEEFKPNLIALDLRMPKMGGLEFLRRYDVASRKNVKIIIFSNYDEPVEIDEAYKLGIDRYILKVLTSPRELVKIVKETLLTARA